MTPEMDAAAKQLEDARLDYALAESNLAVARGDLSRAERRFHEIWGKALANPAKAAPLPPSERNADENTGGGQ